MLDNLKEKIENSFLLRPNKNQLCDLKRLIFEIIRRENCSLDEVFSYLTDNSDSGKYSGRDKFFALKSSLLKRRFPLTAAKERIDTKRIFLNQIPEPINNNYSVRADFKPSKIIVEKEVKNSYLVRNFSEKFPDVKIQEINRYSDYLDNNKFHISKLKEPIVFLIKEKWDFLKPCPCTKVHLSCGYWVLNLGFGCPFDCSYCFLQCYTNFPGIILPANIEDFFTEFDALEKKLKKPIRIGTGEFCDSLALDEITEYSTKLIPYFKDKNVFFELKTKSNKISNLLKITPSQNIVISWSLNPPSIIEREEIATASLTERLNAAKKLQQKGYNIAFHFDPIFYSERWKQIYRQAIDDLYSHLKPPFAWISLGTLRSHRRLKAINEARFPKSNIFYGELFVGEDKKLRYPSFLRREIYENMVQWIKGYDKQSPIYLCMEDKDMWSILNKGSSMEIEKYLLKI
ncbi:MAG: spore photoproduct lyase family protein [Candidatus Omnitrophota bacterium]|jgi:spore photoproduct lyase